MDIVIFLKNNWKVATIVLLVILLLHTCNRNKNLIHEKAAIEATSDFEKKSLDSSVSIWIDANKELHYRLNASYSYSQQLEGKYIDSIAKLLKIHAKEIESISQIRVVTQIKEKLRVDTVQHDTCYSKNGDAILRPLQLGFNWKDPWTDIKGSIGVKGNDIQIQSVDTLTAVDYWQRNKILGLRIGKVYGYVDYTNRNPHNSITGGKKIELRQPKDRWGVGVAVGLGYPLAFKQIKLDAPIVTVGVTLQRTFIRF